MNPFDKAQQLAARNTISSSNILEQESSATNTKNPSDESKPNIVNPSEWVINAPSEFSTFSRKMLEGLESLKTPIAPSTPVVVDLSLLINEVGELKKALTSSTHRHYSSTAACPSSSTASTVSVKPPCPLDKKDELEDKFEEKYSDLVDQYLLFESMNKMLEVTNDNAKLHKSEIRKLDKLDSSDPFKVQKIEDRKDSAKKFQKKIDNSAFKQAINERYNELKGNFDAEITAITTALTLKKNSDNYGNYIQIKADWSVMKDVCYQELCTDQSKFIADICRMFEHVHSEKLVTEDLYT